MNTPEGMEQLEEIFHRALKLEQAKRAHFLAQIGASDPDLAAEVQSLIATYEQESSFIDSPAYEAAASLIVKAQDAGLAGSSINHYRVLNLLGKGGMGEVYLARDTKLHREVALKVLPQAFANDGERLALFEREAQVLASLNHPNIAIIYDLVECEGKQVLVLELVEGDTLADRLEQDRLPLTEAIKISLQIAEALQVAHKKGIIHRDLKPANIKITPEGQVKVLDFGLAKQSQTDGNDEDQQPTKRVESVTITGMVVGTPAYMSPEQAVGEAADARSDIFSFGAVLYEMLVGKRAFSGNNIPATLQSVLHSTPASPRLLRREIPVELDGMVMRALQKDREQRQQSMEQICVELSRLKASMSARPLKLAPSIIERARAISERLRSWRIGIGRKGEVIFLLLVMIALSVMGWLVFQKRDISDASLSAAPARLNANAAPHELFQQGLVYLERYDKEENIEAAFRAFNAALSKNQNYAPAYAGLGLAYVARFQNNRDESLLELAAQNAKQAVKLDGHMSISRISLGRAYAEKGDYESAQSELEQAKILDPLNASVYRGLADIQSAKRNWAEAERLYQKAIEYRPNDWEMHFLLGNLYYRLARYAEAEKAYIAVINLVPDSHVGYRNLGGVYHMQGRFPEASDQYQKSLQIKPSATTYSNLGTSLFFQGLYQQSVTAFKEAIKLGADNYQIWANLGDAYRQTPGNEEEAREAFQNALQLAREWLSRSPDDGDLRSQLALYLAKLEETQEALDQAARAKKLDQSAPVLATLVLVYEICGQREQALEAMAAALKAGYSLEEFSRDPELLEMRKDPKYRKMVVKFSGDPHN